MRGESRLRSVGSFGLGLVIVAGIFLVLALFMHGMVWASEKLYPWLLDASEFALAVCIFFLLPLCGFKKTRPWAGNGFYIASFLFGAMLFTFSCLIAYNIWGYTGLMIGLVFAGVGVVPVAFLATLLNGEWMMLVSIVLGLIMTYGSRLLGLWLSASGPAGREEEIGA